jgi:hypothetical protein
MTTTPDTPIQAVRQSQRGLGVGGRIYFESTISKTPISYDDAQDAQARAGKHPAGYGFFGFSCKAVEGGYQATWNCSASCD